VLIWQRSKIFPVFHVPGVSSLWRIQYKRNAKIFRTNLRHGLLRRWTQGKIHNKLVGPTKWLLKTSQKFKVFFISFTKQSYGTNLIEISWFLQLGWNLICRGLISTNLFWTVVANKGGFHSLHPCYTVRNSWF